MAADLRAQWPEPRRQGSLSVLALRADVHNYVLEIVTN